jgi:hypothetical protein
MSNLSSSLLVFLRRHSPQTGELLPTQVPLFKVQTIVFGRNAPERRLEELLRMVLLVMPV